MADNSGTHMGKNPIKVSMDSCLSNAVEISQSTTDSLIAYTGNDARVIAAKNYHVPLNAVLQSEAPKQVAFLEAQKTATKQVKLTVADMQINLKSWTRQIDAVYNEGTEKYDLLLIGGATSFYKGSRTDRKIRVDALIVAIGSDPLLSDLKIQVQAYSDLLAGKTAKQSSGKTAVKDNSVLVKKAVDNASKGLWFVYCSLILVFIENPAQALAFFPMRLIYKAANEKRYIVMILEHCIKKLCIHLFKAGETITMTNDGTVDVQIGLALNAKSTVVLWYNLPAGHTVTISPALLGDLSYKFVMLKNEDLELRGHITFVINVA